MDLTKLCHCSDRNSWIFSDDKIQCNRCGKEVHLLSNPHAEGSEFYDNYDEYKRYMGVTGEVGGNYKKAPDLTIKEVQEMMIGEDEDSSPEGIDDDMAAELGTLFNEKDESK